VVLVRNTEHATYAATAGNPFRNGRSVSNSARMLGGVFSASWRNGGWISPANRADPWIVPLTTIQGVCWEA
jgi:hypothetical protein